MKKLATCVVAITGFIGTSAFAADMGVPAAPPPAPVWNWTGWYAGVNLGASFGNAKTDFNVSPVRDSGGPFTFAHGFSDREFPDGFMGGGQIGYNWQYSPLIVVGVEADFQGAAEKDNVNNLSQSFGDFGGAIPTQVFTNYTTQIDWFGTVRARIGYVWGNGNVMSYLTGGLAYGEVKINGTNTTSFVCPTCPATGSVSQAFGHSQVNTGWVAGYGTEGRLGASNWTWKVEGLYMGLGTLDTTGVTTGSSSTGAGVAKGGVFGGQVTTHTRFTDGILRGGLNYKFY